MKEKEKEINWTDEDYMGMLKKKLPFLLRQNIYLKFSKYGNYAIMGFNPKSEGFKTLVDVFKEKVFVRREVNEDEHISIFDLKDEYKYENGYLFPLIHQAFHNIVSNFFDNLITPEIEKSCGGKDKTFLCCDNHIVCYLYSQLEDDIGIKRFIPSSPNS